MITKINGFNSNSNYNYNVPFQASLHVEIPTKYGEKLAEVGKIFADKSQHYKYDILTLGNPKDPYFKRFTSLRISNATCCGDYRYSHILENFDEMMENMSANEIAKKFLRYFKIMKAEKQFDCVASSYNNKIEKTEALKRQFMYKAARYEKHRKSQYVRQCDAMANNFQSKIDKLTAEKNRKLNIIADNMDKAAGNDRELSQISEICTEVEQVPRTIKQS